MRARVERARGDRRRSVRGATRDSLFPQPTRMRVMLAARSSRLVAKRNGAPEGAGLRLAIAYVGRGVKADIDNLKTAAARRPREDRS